tara:strand:- start:329 stop:3547 length:3219 start_codon:yes stop_codon:yes gene_type:complete
MAIPDLPEIKTDINKRSKKNQIQLFGTKKKTSADKVLEELRNANVPAILIKLPNEQVGVFNLATNKYEYKGDIETESTTVRSNVEDLKDFAFIKNLEQTDTSQKLQTSDDADETYMTLDFDVISTEDIFGKGTRYEPDIYDDRVMRLARQEQMTDLDVIPVDTFGDYRSADYVPNTDFPRRSTFEELNPNLRGANPDDPLITRIGDRLQKLYSLETIRGQSPVSGSIVATGQPVLSGTMALSMGLGMSEIFSGVGNQFLGMQEDQAMKAAEGVPGYTAFTAIDLGTGRPVDITAKPGVGGTVTTNLDVQGPLALDGKVFYSPLEAARYAAANGLVSEYSLRMYGDIDYLMEDQAKKNLAKQQVQVDPTRGMGDYNPDDGSVNLGAGLKGDVRGIALADDGTLALKTGASGFIMSGGEMAKVSQGIGFSGLRGGIGTKSLSELSSAEAKGLLERIESGEITSTPKTTAALQTFVGEDIVPDFIPDYTYGDYTVPNIPRSPITEIGFTDVTGSMAGRFQEGESGVIYGDGDRFSETLDTDVYSEGFTEEISFDPPASQPPDPFFDQSDVGITTPEPVFAPDPFFDSSNNDNEGSGETSVDSYDASTDMGFGTAEGGRIGKQEGGTSVKPVSQIIQGAGFIAPQQNATDEQTIADDIPMEAEEGDFIINAPAAEFAGRQDIVDMILEAIQSLKEKGIDIQYGNPKIPVKNSVQLAVSRNEVYIPKIIAEEIGYDKLEKINNRGKREVERRQQESQRQANRGGFVRKAEGDVVKDESSIVGTDDSSFLQDLGKFVVDELGDKIKGFLSPKEEPKPVKEQEKQDLKKEEKFPEAPPPKDLRFFGEKYPLLVQALERVETGDVSKDVQTTEKFKNNPYRFTQVTIKGPKGSSAFGLRQLTYTAMEDMVKKYGSTLTPSEMKYAREFIDMGKQRINLENTRKRKRPFVYEGPDDNRVKIFADDKARKLGMSKREYIRRLSPLGEGLIPIAAHKKHYNTFADLFFTDKLKRGKSLEDSIGAYYGGKDLQKRRNYVDKFKKALGRVKMGVKPVPIDMPMPKPEEIQARPDAESFLAPPNRV